jgi:hypothetical protein
MERNPWSILEFIEIPVTHIRLVLEILTLVGARSNVFNLCLLGS